MNIRILLLVLSLAMPATAAFAHHAMAEYDFEKPVEIEGTLTDVRWQNPHILLKVRAPGGAPGKPMIWDVEGSSLSVVRRMNVTPEKLKVGDTVRVAGFASRRAPNRMVADNLLQADGSEIVFLPGAKPRWAKTAIGSRNDWLKPGTSEKASVGLFRVWSTKLDSGEPFWLQKYPLTDAARKARERFDPVKDELSRDCEPKGMPTIMEQPYPIEFVNQKETILLRIEEYDTVRTIHMNGKVAASSLLAHRLGRSTGRWEGSTLVVKTDGITWPWLGSDGTPLSPAATLVERFTPTPDGTRLQYSVVITDPKVLTEPVELKRSWVARAKEVVQPYNCGRS